MKPLDAPFPAYGDWSFSIGHFLLQFGILEFKACAYLKDHLPSHAATDFKKSHFTDRLKAIEQHFVTAHSEKIISFQEWRQRVKPIQALRNHIAHGYMLFTDKTPNPSLCISQVNNLDDDSAKRLTLPELDEAIGSLTTLFDEFARLTGWSAPKPIQEDENSVR